MLKPYRGTAFKYRGFKDFGNKEKGRIERMFSCGELNFSNPMAFNDPFECNPSTNYKPQELREYLSRLGNKHKISLTSQQLSDQMQEYKDYGFGDDYQQYLGKNIGIYCMSKFGNIVTQWAYYAENGKGFCIEYDINQLENIAAIEVNYDDPRPIVDIVKFQKDPSYRMERMKEVISRKSSNWKHEEEVRLFSGTVGLINIPTNKIRSLILGFAIEKPKEEYILDIVNKNMPSLKIYKASLDKAHYKINIT